jgi:acylphosphatase
VIRADVMVSGRVQGVFYRASAQQEAMRLSLVGEIRNLPDGRVEAVVEGPKERIEEFVEWCRRGPPAADVEHVGVRWSKALGEFRTFMVSR